MEHRSGGAISPLLRTAPVVLAASATALALCLLGMRAFDRASYGAGGVSFTGTGTYSVTSSCAGTTTLNISGGEVDHTAFVVLNGGTSIYSIGEDPDDVFMGSSTRR